MGVWGNPLTELWAMVCPLLLLLLPLPLKAVGRLTALVVVAAAAAGLFLLARFVDDDDDDAAAGSVSTTQSTPIPMNKILCRIGSVNCSCPGVDKEEESVLRLLCEAHCEGSNERGGFSWSYCMLPLKSSHFKCLCLRRITCTARHTSEHGRPLSLRSRNDKGGPGFKPTGAATTSSFQNAGDLPTVAI
jgi:hypothetical protein